MKIEQTIPSKSTIDMYRHPWEISFEDFRGTYNDKKENQTGSDFKNFVTDYSLEKSDKTLSNFKNIFGFNKNTNLKTLNIPGREFFYPKFPNHIFVVLDDKYKINNENPALLYNKKGNIIAGYYDGHLVFTKNNDFDDINSLLILSLARASGNGRPHFDASTVTRRRGLFSLAHRDACLLAYSCGLQVPYENVERYGLNKFAMRPEEPGMRVIAAARHAQSILPKQLTVTDAGISFHNGSQQAETAVYQTVLPNGEELNANSAARFMKTLLPLGHIMNVGGHDFFIDRNIVVDLSPAREGKDIVLLNLNVQNHRNIFEKKFGSISEIKYSDVNNENDYGSTDKYIMRQ